MMLRRATASLIRSVSRVLLIRSGQASGKMTNMRPFSNNTGNIVDYVSSNKLGDIDLSKIRNFSVIAHVDHGKSTLSDAILQLTGNIDASKKKKGQVLDTLKVERDRGITVKAQTASMISLPPKMSYSIVSVF